MAPRSSSATASSSPYSRRPGTHPKSSRQQFSACGACRMRRVRCDLKDLTLDTSGPPPSCSNCKERGLKCVDEFAEVKTVKLLRRGRRLQQVEAIYGKAGGPDLSPPSYTFRPASTIPQLQPEFFSSSFWHRFGVQRPILDPAEFAARFNAHHNGSHRLSLEGKLISMLLAVWAFSLGVDERGVEHPDSDREAISDCMQGLQSDNGRCTPSHDEWCRRRKDDINAMVREVLQLVDSSSIMRKPSWDGVRILLLLLPLMEDSQLPLEVLATYEASMGQIRGLASLSSLTPPFSPDAASPSIHAYMNNALPKARIFWYAYVHEGITAGLRGGRLMLDDVDLETFQKALPNFDNNAADPQPSSMHSALLPASALFPLPTQQRTPVSCQPQDSLPYAFAGQQRSGQLSSQQSYLNATRLFTVPLRISNICRKVHAVLTGRDARRRVEHGLPIDADSLQEVWDGLDACWRELDPIRRSAVGVVAEDLEQHARTWQIFIFECHNIIRDTLKQYIISQSPPGVGPYRPSPTHLTPPPSSAPSVFRLHTLAVRRCMKLLPLVLHIIKVHLQIAESPLFRWDTGLIGDGCFFAGFLAAGGENDHAVSTEDASADHHALKQEEAETSLVRNEGVELCLRALREMRWTFAKAEERAQTIQMVSNARRPQTQCSSAAVFPQHESLQLVDGFLPFDSHSFMQPLQDTSLPPHRPYVPPLNLALTHTETLLTTTASASTPPTASTDTSGSWRAYTPPGTGTSGSGSTLSGTGDSPVYATLPNAHLQGYAKGGDLAPGGDMLYQAQVGIAVDMNPFSFSVPVSGYPHQCGHHGQDTCGWQLPEGCRCF